MSSERDATMNRRKDLVKRFRKVAWGRLYWNMGRNSLMQHMDGDDVCIVRDGTLTTHYKTIDAFVEELENAEELDQDVASWIGERDAGNEVES
jgi:hypothetical protein